MVHRMSLSTEGKLCAFSVKVTATISRDTVTPWENKNKSSKSLLSSGPPSFGCGRRVTCNLQISWVLIAEGRMGSRGGLSWDELTVSSLLATPTLLFSWVPHTEGYRLDSNGTQKQVTVLRGSLGRKALFALFFSLTFHGTRHRHSSPPLVTSATPSVAHFHSLWSLQGSGFQEYRKLLLIWIQKLLKPLLCPPS